jgi:hypothetical protein
MQNLKSILIAALMSLFVPTAFGAVISCERPDEGHSQSMAPSFQEYLRRLSPEKTENSSESTVTSTESIVTLPKFISSSDQSVDFSTAIAILAPADHPVVFFENFFNAEATPPRDRFQIVFDACESGEISRQLSIALRTRKEIAYNLANATNSSGMTALSYVCANTRISDDQTLVVAKLLLERGANINQPSGSSCYTPIIWAGKNQKVKTIKLLLAKDAKCVSAENQFSRREVVQYLGFVSEVERDMHMNRKVGK